MTCLTLRFWKSVFLYWRVKQNCGYNTYFPLSSICSKTVSCRHPHPATPMPSFLISEGVVHEFHKIHETLDKLKTWKHPRISDLHLHSSTISSKSFCDNWPIWVCFHFRFLPPPPSQWDIEWLRNMLLVEFLWILNKLAKTGCLKVEKSMLSEFWKLDLQSQSLSKAVFPLKALGENPAWPLAASGGCCSPWHFCLTEASLSFMSVSTWHSSHVSVFVQFHFIIWKLAIQLVSTHSVWT